MFDNTKHLVYYSSHASPNKRKVSHESLSAGWQERATLLGRGLVKKPVNHWHGYLPLPLSKVTAGNRPAMNKEKNMEIYGLIIGLVIVVPLFIGVCMADKPDTEEQAKTLLGAMD